MALPQFVFASQGDPYNAATANTPLKRAGRHACIFAVAALSLCAQSAEARVKKIVLDRGATSPWSLADKSFGDIGTYVRVRGTAYGELDPTDPRNNLIQDIALAPRNANGKVEYEATFTLVMPSDKSRWSKVIVYEVVNRGASIEPRRYESGDAFLVSGWQGDLPFGGESVYGSAGETIRVPTAHNADGSPVTGPVLATFVNVAPGLNTLSLHSATGYATSGPAPKPASTNTQQAQLTRIAFTSTTGIVTGRQEISSKDWSWGDCTKQPFPGTPSDDKICLKSGFNPLMQYQLEYTGKDPLVLGIGLAAIRDVAAFFKTSEQDDAGWKNPLAKVGKVTVIGRGASQAGNTLRTFINLGFNQAEDGSIVFDGAMPVIAARQNPVNYRFAIPGGASGLQEIGSDGVVWWSHWEDDARGHPAGGLLDRCTASNTCPKVMEVLGSSEFWSLRATPDFIGTAETQDIPLPPNVRRYYIASTQHGGGNGGFHTNADPPAGGRSSSANPILTSSCVFAPNPNPMSQVTKALLLALEQWVLHGTAPPDSQYPTLAAHTLAPANAFDLHYPRTATPPHPDGLANPLLVYDLGSGFRYNDLSGFIDARPSKIDAVIPAFAPTVDADANEVGGIHTVLQQAALGTYLGWNVTASGFHKGELCGLSGSFIPFARTLSERLANHDARLSLEDRYGTERGYMCVVDKAVSKLLSQRLLLADDAEALRKTAAASKILQSGSENDAKARQTADKACEQPRP